jgi:hypothetical protein
MWGSAMRARHSDHIELAGRDGVPGCRDVLDARGVEHRELGRRAHLASKVEMRRRFRAHSRDHVRERLVGLDVAADDVDEIDEPARRQAAGDLDAFFLREALIPVLVAHHAHADDEIGTDARVDRLQHLDRETHPVLEAAAIGIVALVGGGRPELVGEMAVALDLEPIEAARLGALGGLGVLAHDPRDVPVLGGLRKRAMRRFPHRARRHHRKPVASAPERAAAQMRDLDHDGSAVRVDLVAELLQPAHDLVFVEEDVAEGLRAVGRDHRRAADHGERNAALGLLGVIEPVALLRHAVFGVGRLVRRRHEPISETEVLQPERLQQGIVRAHSAIVASVPRRATRS